ncbi:glycolipid transfer protein domain-containing protein [Gymnopilus junonius]|uniref:Glycolipid transfer protein domain-containing protein n=1 Tax=Gymnopilus junonius TaxID=109634 RepID=A0A9P5TIA3_GYMJU|nr:glycolipid transfer protein domain-containing protein [Gymnopilus junonius]
MAPYFETVKSFAEVPFTEEGVETGSFLEASDGLVQMFDLLGSGVFAFVQTDIRNNIHGVRSRYEVTKDRSGTLEELVRSEYAELEGQKNATPCLVRLTRQVLDKLASSLPTGLSFTCKALQNMQHDPGSELHICFKRSYDDVLRHHHTFIIRSVVSLAIRAVPRRDDFYAKISQGGSIEKLDAALANGFKLRAHRSTCQHLLEQGGYGEYKDVLYLLYYLLSF